MDNLWERSIPFYNIDVKEATEIFKKYDRQFEVVNLLSINVGCRNSNYKVTTNKGNFLLRICPINDLSYKKEQSICELFYEGLRIPKLFFICENSIIQRTCLIYEYIDGTSMQEIIIQNGKIQDDILAQVAESAAYIHNHDDVSHWKFQTLEDYPPFSTWYDLFLSEANVTERLGSDVVRRIKKLILDKEKDLKEIERYISFIHSDFRPSNMLVDKNDKIWIVDWEFAGFGHTLADIGQFFRYSNCFEVSQIKKFEAVYNSFFKRNLPDDWYNLSKLRDLINPLQMIGGKQELSEKYADLKKLVLDTLFMFDY